MLICKIPPPALRACPAAHWLLALFLGMAVLEGKAGEYFVAPTGSDANPGTPDLPFKTFARANSVIVAGDVCTIRGGTYRETMVPKSGTAAAPIVYRAYPNETVTVSGCNLISGWTPYSGQIHKAPWSGSLGDGNQVFVDGVMAMQARWPNNPTGILLPPPWATAESGSSSTSIKCASLPAVALTGASVWIIAGARWEAWTSRITSSSGGTIGFTNNGYPDVASRPGANFYVFGTLPLLDAENEWVGDGQNLYLWVPSGGDPSAHVVEAKARNFGIDLSGKQHVELQGIGILGCTIKTDGGTANIVIDRMHARYVGHWEAANDNFNPPANQKGGIQISGTNIVIKNSTLAYGAGGVLSLEGSRNQIVNSLIHDAGYSGLNAECLGLFGTELLASHNTVHSSGRSVIGMGASRSLIAYNDVSRAGLVTWDVGVFTTGATDGGNSELHHNWFHDNLSTGLARGIFMSTGSNNYLLHHNVVWNCWEGGYHGEPPSEYIQVFNNTFYTTPGSYDSGGVDLSSFTYIDDQVGGIAINNVFTDSIRSYGHDVVIVNNLLAGTDPQFLDPTAFDFRLKSTSPAIGKGLLLDGVTTTSVPDQGAYEGGPWKPGHDFANPPSPDFTFSASPYWNRVQNFGFEFGFAPWTATGTTASVTRQFINADPTLNTNGLVHSNRWGARLAAGACGVQQVATGLRPNTTYILTAWAKLTAAASQAKLGVSGAGFATKTIDFHGAGQAINCWLRRSIVFKTGESDTTATVFVQKTSAGAGTDDVLIDDIGLAQSYATSPRLTTGRADYTLNRGSGLNQFELVGSWGNGGSSTTDAYAQVRFDGQQIVLYGKIQKNGGIGGVSIDGGPETLVDCYYPQLPHHATVQPSVPIYLSPTLPPGPHILKFRVTGTKNSNASDYTILPRYVDILSGDAGLPPIPVGLTAAAVSSSRIDLAWNASSSATSYSVKRATVGGAGPFRTISTGLTATSFRDIGVGTGTLYHYVVSATGPAGESPDSDAVSASALPASNRLTGTIIGTSGSYNSLGNTKEKAMDGDFATAFDAPTASTSWVGLDLGSPATVTSTRYSPRGTLGSRMVNGLFQGSNTIGFSSGAVALATISSAPAEGVFATLPSGNFAAYRYVRYLGPANGYCNLSEVEFYGYAALPLAPTNVTTVGSDARVSLTWAGSVGATSYEIRRSATPDTGYMTIGTTAGTNFTDDGVTNGTKLYYVVVAKNSTGEGSTSEEALATPLSAYQRWKLSQGLALETPDAAMPDGDSLPILLKFATGMPVGQQGLSPAVLSSPAAPVQIRFSRLSPAPVDYIVEGSGNLATWTPIATLLKGQDSWSGPATVSETGAGSPRPVRVTDPTTGGRSRFLRLKINP